MPDLSCPLPSCAGGRLDCQPSCSPPLPPALDADNLVCSAAVLKVATALKKLNLFVIQEE